MGGVLTMPGRLGDAIRTAAAEIKGADSLSRAINITGEKLEANGFTTNDGTIRRYAEEIMEALMQGKSESEGTLEAIDIGGVNALLQARATGKVGAILAENGIATKSGNLTLAMLRGFVDGGVLQECPVVDDGQKTIVYFTLKKGADLSKLDAAASETIILLSKTLEQTKALNLEVGKATEEAEQSLKELSDLLAHFEAAMTGVRGTIAETEKSSAEMAAEGGPDQDAWAKMAAASKAIGSVIDTLMK